MRIQILKSNRTFADTETANEKVACYDLAKVQEKHEIANLTSQNWRNVCGRLSETNGLGRWQSTKSCASWFSGALICSNEWRRGIIGGDLETVAQGAATALSAEKYNRQLHPNELQCIKDLANGDKEKEARFTAAACALVHCSAQISSDDPEYAEAYAKALEDLGNTAEFASERELLSRQYEFYGGYDNGAKKFFTYITINEDWERFIKDAVYLKEYPKGRKSAIF
ncbi:hypothetical protein CFY87_03585 [Actinobacillus seminis]|nr:hypothetical protein [Actinobacillus seminis]OZN25241.1 hypothetical protein CFY87_03585 [Actinobacillus seminis]